MSKNPYIRIIEAAKSGKGVKLSARDVSFMQWDSAIAQVAQDTSEGVESDGGGFTITKDGFREKAID